MRSWDWLCRCGVSGGEGSGVGGQGSMVEMGDEQVYLRLV